MVDAAQQASAFGSEPGLDLLRGLGDPAVAQRDQLLASAGEPARGERGAGYEGRGDHQQQGGREGEDHPGLRHHQPDDQRTDQPDGADDGGHPRGRGHRDTWLTGATKA